MSLIQRIGVAALTVAWATTSLSALAQESAAPSSGETSLRDPDAVAAYNEGAKLLGEEKYKEAVAPFTKALSIDPTFPEPMVGIGKAQLALEDYQGAAVTFTRALDLDAESVDAYAGLGEANMEMGQIDMAQNALRNALERDRNNAPALSSLGHIMANFTRDPTTALQYLDEAIDLNAEDARAYRDRGLAHAQLQEFEDSEADLQKASEIDPGDYENYATLAQIYLFQDKRAEAIDAMTKAIEAYQPKKRGDPKIFIAGYLSRADAQQQLGDAETDPDKRKAAYEAIIADANTVLKDSEDRYPESGVAFYRRGRAERLLERYDDAVDSLTRAIQSVPAGADASWVSDAYLFRGICWYFIDSLELARGDFEQAASTGGGFSDPRVHLWIGITHHKQGDFRKAIDFYSQAIAKSPNFSLAHVNKGRAYVDLKEYAKAIESFNNAIRAEPGVGEYYYNVGLAYNKLEDWKKASDFLSLALKKENPQPKMYREMAVALRGLGRNELASQYEKKAGG